MKSFYRFYYKKGLVVSILFSLLVFGLVMNVMIVKQYLVKNISARSVVSSIIRTRGSFTARDVEYAGDLRFC